MLTIGQLADYVGVTTRAVRHYHQRGLLPEPERDASGYRRYGAQAVVDLIRIKTLADAGVPLARIQALLVAGPEPFAQGIAQIDQALRRRIRDLEQQRRRIAELAAGDRLFLPDEVVSLLDELRRVGVSQRAVDMERDGWILLAARSPGRAAELAKGKRSGLADPEFRRLYLACDQAFDWDPADPRLEEVADAMVAFAARHRPDPGSDPDPDRATLDDPVAVDLLSSPPGGSSPAWEQLLRLTSDRSRAVTGAR
jgi:DNA-binding transcriptional MerR regulator